MNLRTVHKLLLLHGICHVGIVAGALYSSWWMWALAFAWYYVITIVSSSAGYHRYYSHRVFKAPAWFPHVTNFLSLFVGAGSYLTRAAIHRQHHAYVDTEKDPSCPVHKGFWKIYFNLWDDKIERRFFKGLINDSLLRFYQKHYFKMVFLLGITLFSIHPLLFVFAYAVPCALSFHLFGFFNAYLHKDGAATDNWWVNLLTAGEGYHAYHHRYPKAQRNGLIDPTYFFIRFIEQE